MCFEKIKTGGRDGKFMAAKKKKTEAAKNPASEINAPRWSVVSFERRAAKNLTYTEASEKIKQLAAEKVPGLCIITDEAADRIVND